MSVSSFLDGTRTNATLSNYRKGIVKFLSFMGLDTTDLDTAGAAYLAQYPKGNHLQNILRFVKADKSAPKSVNRNITAVKMWLEDEGHELTTKEWKAIKKIKPPSVAITNEGAMDKSIIADMLVHCDVRLRAFVLLLVSSGMRVGEIEALDIGDVDMKSTPPSAWVRHVKSKGEKPRRIFFSQEARAALVEWMKVRDAYVRTSKTRAFGTGKNRRPVDTRVFPFHKSLMQRQFMVALQRSGHYKKDAYSGRGNFTVHSTRKFFRTFLAMRVPVDIVDQLMGHKNYLTDAYRRIPEKILAEQYMKGEAMLTISIPADAVDQSYGKLKEELAAQKQINTILQAQVMELQQAVGRVLKVMDAPDKPAPINLDNI